MNRGSANADPRYALDVRAILPLLPLLAACEPLPDDLPFPEVGAEVPYLSSSDDGAAAACAPERPDRVACGIDGDTVDLSVCGGDAERVRMLGIDAPETAKPGQSAECGADLAASTLDQVLTGQSVSLTFDRDCEGVFGRTLAYVWMDADDAVRALGADDVEEMHALQGDGDDEEAPVLINAWMLWTGLARRYDEDWVEPLREGPLLIAAERIARSRSSGVWGACP